MDALTRRADLLDVEVPRAVWARGRRPWRGAAVRVGVAAGLLLVALLLPITSVRIVLAVLGIAVLMFTTPVADRRLEKLESRIRAADRGQAARLLVAIDRMPLVDLFAPFAWVALQKGRLNLVLGNGRAAAKSFADAGKYAGDPSNLALASAQAHAHVLAGDRKDARAVLATLEEKQQLGPRDRLDYGLVLLEETGRTAAARVHLEAAREALGGHPRVLAALALAYVRGDEGPRALEMLRTAEAAEDVGDDEIAVELIRRAKKAARPLIEAEEKRARRAKHSGDAPSAEAGKSSAASAKSSTAPMKKDKKDRRKERREKRKAEREAKPDPKAEATTKAVAAVKAEMAAKAEAAAKAQREAAERAKAEASARLQREAAERAKKEAAAKSEAAKLPSPPVFAPPPLPETPAAPSVAAPPVLAPPVVPKIDSAPAVDADGWDDLLGDAPPPKPKP